METVTTATVVIAVVEAVKTVVPTKIFGIVTIVLAVAVGALVGFVSNGNAVQGAVDGLVAVGIVSTANKVGQ